MNYLSSSTISVEQFPSRIDLNQQLQPTATAVVVLILVIYFVRSISSLIHEAKV